MLHFLSAVVLISAPPKAELVEVRKVWDRAPHNAFTDLVRFDNTWFCVFRQGKASEIEASLAEDRIIAVRQVGDEIMRGSDASCSLHLLQRRQGLAIGNVGGDCVAEHEALLKDHADIAAKINQIDLLQFHAVHQNSPLCRVVKPA